MNTRSRSIRQSKQTEQKDRWSRVERLRRCVVRIYAAHHRRNFALCLHGRN